jgi:hypothetical protein
VIHTLLVCIIVAAPLLVVLAAIFSALSKRDDRKRKSYFIDGIYCGPERRRSGGKSSNG